MPFAPREMVGPYEIVERLGHGGMATVWKAYHAPLDRYVAIKVLHPVFVDDEAFLLRFHREAKIVARLVHPHIIPVYDFSQEDGMPYLVMRYVEGETLKTILKSAPLSLSRILEIFRPVAEALEYAHAQGVLHRDIKPSNIMETPQGEIFLTDFGLAKMMEEEDSTFSREMMVGTPQYISPEQAKGEELDRGTDIYSLGVILFEMLTGSPPFDGDTPYAIIHAHIFSPLPPLSQLQPTIPQEVEEVVLKALAKERRDRFQSVGEMMAALEETAGGLPPTLKEKPFAPSPPPETKPKTAEIGHKFPWLISTLFLLLLALCSCLGFGAFRWWQGRPLARALAAVQANPQDVEARLTLARLYQERGMLDEALASYLKVLELEPDNLAGYLGAANILFLQGKYKEAASHYRKAAALQPDLALPHARLARYLLSVEDLEAARQELERALEIEPDLIEAHFVLGLLLKAEGDTQGARREFQSVLDSEGPAWLKKAAREELNRLP